MRKEHIIKAMFIAVAVVMFMFFFSSEASAAWTACYEYTTYVSAYWDGSNYKYYDDCYDEIDYFCDGDTPKYYSRCPSHCTVGCGAPSCECTSGVCCDGCNYRSTSYACGGPYYDYGCPWGTSCGADGGYRYRYRYCSGYSSSCTGSYGSWSSWYVNDSCSSSEYCSGGYCYSQCSSGVCCDGCRYRSSSYSCDADTDYNYGCPWGTTAGDDAGYQYRTRYRYCSGSSSSCSGSWGSWSGWSSWYTYDSCSTSEYCSGGNCITITCSYNPTGCDSILNCPDGSICDCDAECQNACDFRYGSWGLCYTALKPIGESCTADSECDSGHCVDGVCCNTSCTGTCRTCYFSSTYKGTCYYWNSDTDPDNECYGTGTCGGTCNGGGACQFPSTSVTCGTKDCDYLDSTCRNYYDVTRYCNGAGSCSSGTCNSYTNASAGTDCGTCKICNGSGSCSSTPADDSACGTIDCDGLDTYHQTGSDSPTGTDYCYYKNYNDLTSNRCEGFGNCKDANTTSDCTDYSDTLQYSCGTCKYVPSNYCTGSTKGSCANYAEGTSCGTNKECNGSGTCVTCYYPTGSISASKTSVDTGEQFTISVTGNDDNDVWYISCNEGSNIWNSGTEQKCSFTQTECTRSWNYTKSTGGTYTYYGRVRDSDDAHGCSSWHEAGIGSVTVTVTQIDSPTARTDPATNVEETTATLKGAVTDTGGADYRVRFNYGDTSSYGSNSAWSSYYSYTTSFSCNLSSLTRGKTYHFRIQAQNSAGYGYGSDRTFITKPNPPSSFSATAVSESQINLSWSKGSGAYYTMVRRKTGSYPTSPSDGTQVYYGTGTSKSDTGLSSGTTYYYRAWSRGYEEGYYSDYSDSYASDYATTPSCDPPTGSISASKTEVDTGEEFTISITGYDDNDVWYITYNKDSNIWNDTNQQKCLLTQTECTKTWNITENTPGTYTYYGRVRDSDDAHGCSSWHEAGIGSVTVTVTQIDSPTARTDPATNVEETTATLKGAVTDTGGADYRVRFNYGDTSSYGSNSGWTDYYSYTTSFTWDKTGLTRGKTYHFRIQAENSVGSGYGSDKTFITKPDPPSSFTTTATSANQIDLSWSKGSGAYYTMIRRKTGSYPTSPSDGIQAYYGAGTSKSDTGLTAGTTYYYRAWSRAYEETLYQYSDSYASGWATTFSGVCSSLSYPTDKWQRVWYEYDPGSGTLTNCIGDDPETGSNWWTNETFDKDWGSGVVGGYKEDEIGFKSSRRIYFGLSGFYNIAVGSNDGFKLWIDTDGNGSLELVMDFWYDKSFYPFCYNKAVEIKGVGYHKFRLDYYDNTGNARISFIRINQECKEECGGRGYSTWGSHCTGPEHEDCQFYIPYGGDCACPGEDIDTYGCGSEHCHCCVNIFNLSANPSSGSVGQGDSISTTVNVATSCNTSGGDVEQDYSVSGLPSGASASFNPTKCNLCPLPCCLIVCIEPSCSSEMTISTASYTPTGTYSIIVDGTAHRKTTKPTTYYLTVTEPKPDLVITNGWDDNGIVEYTIKNQGAGDAGESYTALYIKDTTDTWVYQANDYEGPLSAGGSRGYGSSQQSFPTYTLANRATDCAGRAEMPVSVCADYYGARVDESNEDNNCYAFTLDCDVNPPDTTISPNGKDWVNYDVPFTLTCNDGTGSGCQTTQYKIIEESQVCNTSGLTTGTSGTVTCPTDQAYKKKVCFRSIDNAGNEEAIKTSNLFKIDKAKPTTE